MSERPIKSYRDLEVWRDGRSLAVLTYHLTKGFPRDELFGLTSQIRRSAASVPANIAEGHGRENTQSFIQFLRIAQGSLKELETLLLLAEGVGLIDAKEAAALLVDCESLGKRVRLLIRSLQKRLADRR